jgi:hypothetical protein
MNLTQFFDASIMNLTQFFDASIKLQKCGYQIHSIDADDKSYLVRFAYADVCSRLAFGGIQYDIEFYKGSTQPIFAHKMVVRQLRINFETTCKVHSIDEAVDFIISDIQKIEAEEMKKERQKILDKLTPREREVLGV